MSVEHELGLLQQRFDGSLDIIQHLARRIIRLEERLNRCLIEDIESSVAQDQKPLFRDRPLMQAKADSNIVSINKIRGNI